MLRISYISDPSRFYLIMVEWKKNKKIKKLMTEIKVMNGVSVSCIGIKL